MFPMRVKYTIATLALVAAASVAGAIYWGSRRLKATPAAPQPAAPPAADLSFTATVRAKHVVAVAAPVTGTVEELVVAVGEPVYEGQIVARIKNSTLEHDKEEAARDLAAAEDRVNRFDAELAALRLELSRARADAARAQAEAESVQKRYLLEQTWYNAGAWPRLKFEKTEKEYAEVRQERDALAAGAAAAQERVDAAQKRFDDARVDRDEKGRELEAVSERAAAAEVRAPVEGILVGTARAAGEDVTAGIPDLLRIAVNVAELEAVLEPPPPALARIKPEQEVLFAELTEMLPGKVREVAGNQVIVDFSTPNPAVRPGMTAQVRLRMP
jgi:multidrug efflux pump subunit AcrA (membrane-fusion protein)